MNLQTDKINMQNNCYTETEKLLYAYPILLHQIQQTQQDIDDLRSEIYTERSKDIIITAGKSSVRQDKDEIQDERIKKREESMKRTIREVKRIEYALGVVRNDEGYKIINLKYFKCLDTYEIADRLNIGQVTVHRYRKRLIRKMALVLFGVDAM